MNEESQWEVIVVTSVPYGCFGCLCKTMMDMYDHLKALPNESLLGKVAFGKWITTADAHRVEINDNYLLEKLSELSEADKEDILAAVVGEANSFVKSNTVTTENFGNSHSNMEVTAPVVGVLLNHIGSLGTIFENEETRTAIKPNDALLATLQKFPATEKTMEAMAGNNFITIGMFENGILYDSQIVIGIGTDINNEACIFTSIEHGDFVARVTGNPSVPEEVCNDTNNLH